MLPKQPNRKPMEAFKTIIWIVNIFSSLAIIALVLMQHGKGADAGASFGGSGSAQGVFGSSGNANFLTRMTAITASIFFASCLALGYVNSKSSGKASGLDFSNVQQSQMASNVAAPPSAPTMETTAPPTQSASAESASATAQSNNSNAGAAAAIAGSGAVAGKVVADKKDSSKSASKKADADKKKATSNGDKKKSNTTEKNKTSSKPAAKTEIKKTEKSSK